MNAKTTPKYYATRDFKDAGTERQFTAGAEVNEIEDGALANYVAARLVTTERPKADDVAAKPAA